MSTKYLIESVPAMDATTAERADRRELLVVAPLKFAVEVVMMAEQERTR